MEKGTSWDLSLLVEVLTQGEEQIRQLEARLGEPSSAELCKSLAQQIQFAFNKAISMAKSMDPEGSRHPLFPNNASSDSPRSASESPRSENSEKAHEQRELPTKRKSLPKWTSQVRISSNASAGGPLDDGFSWRKYGQKDILGAKYPRGYYRCTYRKTQGCLATKQVQRSDEDPTIFDVTYRGAHTCLQRPRVHSASASQEPDMQQNQQSAPVDHEQQHPPHDQHLLLSFQTGLNVKTEGLAMENQGPTSSSFSFSSTPVSSLKSEKQIISSPPTLENNFTGSFFSTFFPPTTSESSYYSVPCQIDSYGGRPALHASESDITEMISATTSGTPMIDMDFMLEPPIDFEQNFPFDNSKFFLAQAKLILLQYYSTTSVGRTFNNPFFCLQNSFIIACEEVT